MTNLRKLPSGDAVINTETGETAKCDLDAPQKNRRAWMAWVATLPPLESEPASSTGLDALHECRDVLGAKSAESCIDAARRVVAESKAKDEQIAALRRLTQPGLIREALGMTPYNDGDEPTVDAARRILAENRTLRRSIEGGAADIRRIFGMPKFDLGDETTDDAARRVVSERDVLKAELAAAKDESTQQRERAKNAGRELELMQLQVCDYVKTVKAIHAQITEATKVADKACEERDCLKRAVANRDEDLTVARATNRALEHELSTLRAQRERMPAKLVEAAKSYLSSFGDRYLAIHGFGLAGEILRDLAACEPAAMLTVDDAIEAVHSMKERALGLDIVTVVNAEDALRKAVKS